MVVLRTRLEDYWLRMNFSWLPNAICNAEGAFLVKIHSSQWHISIPTLAHYSYRHTHGLDTKTQDLLVLKPLVFKLNVFPNNLSREFALYAFTASVASTGCEVVVVVVVV